MDANEYTNFERLSFGVSKIKVNLLFLFLIAFFFSLEVKKKGVTLSTWLISDIL